MSGLGSTVAIVGVGNMGSQILLKLIPHVTSVFVFDTDAEACSRAARAGAVVVASPGEAVDQADAVLTILPRDHDVEQAALGRDGLLSRCGSSCLWLEMSTIDPETTRALGAQADEAEISMVDAAIVGRFGDLSFLIGGTALDFQRACTLLAPLGQAIWCGARGAGVAAKVVNNMLAGTIFVATCEALILGLRSGLTLEVLLEVLERTAAGNAHLRGSIPRKVANREFEAGFSLELMQKDLSLARVMAARREVPVYLADAVYELRETALARGLGKLDTAALAMILEDAAGCQIEWLAR